VVVVVVVVGGSVHVVVVVDLGAVVVVGGSVVVFVVVDNSLIRKIYFALEKKITFFVGFWPLNFHWMEISVNIALFSSQKLNI
jgi:hypothetical protein